MSRQSLTNTFTFLFFLFAGVSWVYGEPGVGLLGRLTIADFFGVVIIVWTVVRVAIVRDLTLALPNEYKAFFPLLGVFALGAIFALYPERAFIELLVHFFIFSVSACLAILYSNIPPKEALSTVLRLIFISGTIIAAIGHFQFFVGAEVFGPSIGGLVGTFRNTGQAGSFFLVLSAILVPAVFSGHLQPTANTRISVAIIILALLLTFKRASILGAAVGAALVFVSLAFSTKASAQRIMLKSLVLSIFGLTAAGGIIAWLFSSFELVSWRLERKFRIEQIQAFSEGFLADQIDVATSAFLESPILGVGLGNVAGVISEEFEIHSTYFAVLGTGGCLGVICYVYFKYALVKGFAFRDTGSSASLYLSYLLPIFVGLMLAWGYTYHIRKREYWILVLVMVLARRAASYRSRPIRMPRLD